MTVSLLTRRDPRTVNNWIKRFDEDYGIEDRPRTGRPSSTSANESQDIIELAREHPFLVPRDIKHMLDLEVSARTVRRVLDEGSLFARIARHDYRYTSGNFAARIQFAQDKRLGPLLCSPMRHISIWGRMRRFMFNVQ